MRGLLLVLPMIVFLTVFFYVPFAVLAYYSLQTGQGLGPDNYIAIIEDPAYARVLARSAVLAAQVTGATLLLAYPAALYIALRAGPRERAALLGLFIIPFWIDVLLRALALRSLLYMAGVGQGYAAMVLGMIYDYLPLMFLPLYASARNISPSIIDAARTMGAGTLRLLASILLPLTAPGIVAGSLLVFLMSVTEFVIPFLLGGVEGFTVGSLIYYLFLSGGLWGVGAALTIVVVMGLGILAVAASRRAEVGEA